MTELWRDVRYTARAMRKNPLFVLFVVLTLGLGIGANTSIFTLINTLVLNPLPVRDASKLTAVAMTEAKSRSKSQNPLPFSYADLKEYRTRNQVFSDLAGYTSPRVLTLETGNASERMFGELVTGNYFSVLGLKAVIGRFFSPDVDGAPGAHPVAVMSYATWQSRFGGEPGIVGKTLRINGVVLTVIGIAPPKFIGVNTIFGPNLWIPASMSEQLLPSEMQNVLNDRSKTAFLGVGRLKPAIGRTQAQANIATIASSLAREYPETNEGHTATVRPIGYILSAPFVFSSVVLLVVVGLVLLIACSNVANLLLARSAARRQEVAVRLAIGASRGRLMRQFLTESVVLGLLSGIAGFVIGYGGLRLLWSFRPAQVAANLMEPELNASVFLFTLVISLLTGFIFGTIPALRASRASVVESLKEESHTVGRHGKRVTIANALLVGQVAFSFLLLVTAALVLRSIGRAYNIDPGFQTKHLAVFLTNPGQAGYTQARTKAFYKQVLNRVEEMPGVASVSWASNLPLWGRIASGVTIEGRQQLSKSEKITTVLNTVDLDYFKTAGVAIEGGREFNNHDQEDSTLVAVINEKMAHDYWPAGDVIGKRIQLPGETQMRQIVGIARNANYSTLAEPPQSCVYVPLAQNFSDAMTLYVRSQHDPQQIMLAVQREVRATGPDILVNDIRTGHKIIDDALFQAKMGVGLLTIFGLIALGLASIGLYGIMAYSVSQRKREIGLRMALGAAQGNVLRLIMSEGMLLVAAGVAIGFVLALAAGRLLARALYGVSSGDPMSIAAATVALLLVALAACYLPARRASRVDPLVALREG